MPKVIVANPASDQRQLRRSGVKRMRCEIVISYADRRRHQAMAGTIEVGLITLGSMGQEKATCYLLAHGVAMDTIVRVMTMPRKRRR